MASNDDNAGAIIGFILIAVLIVFAVMTAIAIIITTGLVIGMWVGFKNYVTAFRANVRIERPINS